MKRTTVTFTIGAFLVAGAAVVVPSQASALERGHHAPPVQVPVVHQAAASATHRPTDSNTQQVTTAILHSSLLGVVKPSNVAVGQVMYADNGGWAAALATPKNGQTDPAQVLLQKSGTGWTVRDLGTASVGCGIAPQSVRSALGLHGPC